MITTFENRCVFKNYLMVLIPIFDTMYKGWKTIEKYMWALHHELVLFLQGRNFFRYVSENEIEGGILGWTTSSKIFFISFFIHLIQTLNKRCYWNCHRSSSKWQRATIVCFCCCIDTWIQLRHHKILIKLFYFMNCLLKHDLYLFCRYHSK